MNEQKNLSVQSSEQLQLSQVLQQNNQMMKLIQQQNRQAQKQMTQATLNQNALLETINKLIQVNLNQSTQIQELLCLLSDDEDREQYQSLDD
ncbi:hypothetical protein ABW55_10245 [Acinetobacter sp. C15]|uniref:hypothetical protein n=1 Tax=unclassified Acinetobacter TaxID=196816 RepID=UPI0006ABD02A|nr:MULTISPECIES: hypothetical protein [unclassified Acinetobacter]KOR15135.1 hypothetical protein ABW55_10245 [Acinetobacter sp. C15]MDI3379281.1 hypothetical protein [Acinetobacter sp. V89_7]